MIIGVLGAAGATGRHLVRQALDAGHHVRALTRHPGQLQISGADLEIVIGDATDAAAIARLAHGGDAVVSALRSSKQHPHVCSGAARHLIAAGDRRSLGGRAISWVIKRIVPYVNEDKAQEYAVLRDSGTNWTLVRPPRLLDKAGTGKPRVDLERVPGITIAREDVARFVLACASDNRYSRQAPFIAT